MHDSTDCGLDDPERSVSASRLFLDVDFKGEMHLQALFTLNAVNSRKGLVVRILLYISKVLMELCL